MNKKIKRLGIIFAAAFFMLGTSGCFVTDIVEDVQGRLFEKTRFKDDTNYTVVESTKSVSSSSYESLPEITHGYDSLYKESQKECYKLIGQAAFRISETPEDDGLYAIGKVTISDKGFSDRDMDVSIKAFTMDHPEVFWISNRYTYGAAGNQSVIQLYSYVSASECEKRISDLNDKIYTIMSGIPDGLKEYHLEKYIHNTVLDGCTYAKGVQTAEDGWEEFTVYGALVKGSAVCEGYAHAMCMLLNKVGIDCYYANGYGENAPHMWNTVKIYGEWYHLDATWDDNENAYYNFFNLSDSRIVTDHVIEPLITDIDEASLPSVYNLFLPECTSETANFYVIESTFISDFEESRSVMVNDLVKAAQNGDEMFTVRFDDHMAFNDAIDVMFNKEPYYMFDYISDANDALGGSVKINNENLAIIMIENFNAVVVKLEY